MLRSLGMGIKSMGFTFVALFCLASVPHAQVLVNDFTTSHPWTSFPGTLYSSASGESGQVNVGYFTVNSEPDYSQGGGGPINDNLSLLAYRSDSAPFGISGITGFNISMRREINNTAPTALFGVTSQVPSGVLYFSAEIDLASLSTTSFTNIYIPLTALLDRSTTPPSGFPSGITNFNLIEISGNSYTGWGADTYNFSVDSIGAVPEPSALSLLAIGLGVLFRRSRKRD
ncbi:PEP-CTERM sorting domain-containing protein [bacterium]|nr:PEP-CTERM sorting domain-containing protein [bacterium]